MNNLTSTSAPSADSRKEGRSPYPQVFRRTFKCGHPEEFIEIRQEDDGELVHNIITLEVFKAYNTASDTRTAFELHRCLSCARKVREEDNDDPSVRLKRSLGAYQGAAAGRVFDTIPHDRVTEKDHRINREREMLKASTGKPCRISARRVWNSPVQSKDKIQSEFCRSVRTDVSPHERRGNTVLNVVTDPEQTALRAIKDLSDSEYNDGLSLYRRSSSSPPDQEAPTSERTDESSPSSGRASVFKEHLVNQHVSPVDKYVNPRPVPAFPKNNPWTFLRRRGSTSIKTSTKSEPISRNFRKLRLGLQHPRRTSEKAEPESSPESSPDWACQTSLAIEAGKISMDGARMRSRDLTTSKLVSQIKRSHIKILPTGCRLVQNATTGKWRNTYSQSSVGPSRSMTWEGVSQVVPTANVAHRSGQLKGMEIALRKEPSTRRDSAHTTSPTDLNKDLPDLPSLHGSENGSRNLHWI